MTSISEALEIINSDLDAEANERMRNFTRNRKPERERFSSKPKRSNVSEKSAKRGLNNQVLCTLDNSKPEDREHVKIFEQLFGLYTKFFKIIGVDVTYTWRLGDHLRFFFDLFLVVFSWVCIFYTQFIRINNGEMLRLLEAFALYGIASSCTQKVSGYLKHRNQIQSLFFCIRRICRKTSNGSHANILKTGLLKTLRLWKMLVLGVVPCLGFFLFCPLKSYFVDNELTPLLPLEIIFVDQNTYLGFAFANVVMTLFGIYSAHVVLYGAIFIFAILMYDLQVDLIGQDFKDLDDMWADGSTVSLGYKQSFLRNICKKHQDTKDFITAIKGIFKKSLTIFFCFNYFSQIICLFEITKHQWLPGYAIAIGLFIEMMFFCVMGSQIGIADDKLCSIIYNTNWYKYDSFSQKIILLLLHRSQQSNDIILGVLGPLNVRTGIEIVKSIYSYYTVLTELF